jgi:transcriptional regulator GlxA family with amidase domain
MRVVILAPPGVQSLDIVGPAEVFWETDRRLKNPSAYEVQIMSTSCGPICATGGLRFLPDRTIHDPDEPIDTLLVSGTSSLATIDPLTIKWLQRRGPEARRFGSIRTGSLLLAAAGLLDGKHITTHWECAGRLRREYPEIKVEDDRIIIRDGSLCSAAGVTAGVDLALALVHEDYGLSVAVVVARYMLRLFKRAGGQSHFNAHVAAQTV